MLKSSILFYHVFAINNWEGVTEHLLQHVPQDHIAVNINVTKRYLLNGLKAYWYFRKIKKVKYIYFTYNKRSYPEAHSFEKMRTRVPLSRYDILTYMHSKGVTRPENKPVEAWREFMRYFIMDRFDDAIDAFKKGYILYGSKLRRYNESEFGPRAHTYQYCDFWYGGNFVTVNLEKVRDKFVQTPLMKNYFGVEAFWEKLCDIEKAYNAHKGLSQLNLYKELITPDMYRGGKI